MKNYNIKDTPNYQLTSFHELVRLSLTRNGNKQVNPEDFLIINLILDGAAHYKNDTHEWQLPPNSIIITHPGEPHEVILPEENELCTLIYSPTYLKQFITSISKPHAFLLENPDHTPKQHIEFTQTVLKMKWETIEYIKKVYQLMAHIQDPGVKLLQESYFHDALMSLIREDYLLTYRKQLEGNPPKAALRSELDERITQAMEYLHDHHRDEIGMDQLAAVCGMSKFHFSRVFKDQTGQSPHQYLVHIRIEQAKDLLAHTKMGITEIAFEVGFNNQVSFYTAFQKETGMTPKVYRMRQYT
jgi:AraC-like DNA-binding protein